MQAALLGTVVFPPPAAGALRFAGADRTRARGATDRGEALPVQGVGRHAVRDRECLDLLPRPVDQRVELEEAAHRVNGHKARAAALCRLIRPQPGDPAARPGKRAVERLDLADVAAGEARLARGVETIDALRRHEAFERARLGVDGADAAAITLLGLFPGPVGLGKQPPGVERGELDVEPRRADVVQG